MSRAKKWEDCGKSQEVMERILLVVVLEESPHAGRINNAAESSTPELRQIASDRSRGSNQIKKLHSTLDSSNPKPVRHDRTHKSTPAS